MVYHSTPCFGMVCHSTPWYGIVCHSTPWYGIPYHTIPYVMAWTNAYKGMEWIWWLNATSLKHGGNIQLFVRENNKMKIFQSKLKLRAPSIQFT